MKALIKLHIKENLRKNTFIIFAIIGGLISLLVLTSGTFTTNTVGADSDYAQFGYQWIFLTLISSLAGVSLSMSSIPKHREGQNIEILKLHGLSIESQYIGKTLGSVLVSIFMGLLLTLGMVINLILKGMDINILGFLGSIATYLLATISVTLIVSLLSMFFSAPITALFGVFITVMGFIRGTLLIVLGNKGGLFGNVMSFFLGLVPPLDGFGEMARDLFFREVSNWNIFFGNLVYVWVLVGIVYISIKVVSRHEK